MNIELIKASENDASEIWEMQKLAFDELLQRYQDYETSPASEPLEKTVARLRQPYSYFYLIKTGGVCVGAIRVVDKNSVEAKRISPLFILPNFRNKGYAQEAIFQVEKLHGDSNWVLETILQEKTNCHLYEKMGYKRTGRTEVINDKMTMVFYGK